MSYINFFYVFIVIAIVLSVLSVVLFFSLDIPNAVRIVNRKPPKKKWQKSQLSKRTGDLNKKAAIKSKSTNVEKTQLKKKTTVLPANSVSDVAVEQPKAKKGTTVLQTNTESSVTVEQPISTEKRRTTVLQDTQSRKKTGDINANKTNEAFEIIETKAFIASENII